MKKQMPLFIMKKYSRSFLLFFLTGIGSGRLGTGL
jgi:hypothetical protein